MYIIPRITIKMCLVYPSQLLFSYVSKQEYLLDCSYKTVLYLFIIMLHTR